MIDFKNGTYIKLKQVGYNHVQDMITPILIRDEEIISSYKGIRDFVVFTNKRIIAVNVQGITGTKKDFTSLPYSKIQAYSAETAGAGERFTWTGDSELELYFSGLGKVKFEFTCNSNILQICELISEYVL